jgi:hypothetical protein
MNLMKWYMLYCVFWFSGAYLSVLTFLEINFFFFLILFSVMYNTHSLWIFFFFWILIFLKKNKFFKWIMKMKIKNNKKTKLEFSLKMKMRWLEVEKKKLRLLRRVFFNVVDVVKYLNFWKCVRNLKRNETFVSVMELLRYRD